MCSESKYMHFTSPQERSKVLWWVCMFVSSALAYLRNHTAELHQICMHVARGRDRVLAWLRCDTLRTTSGFVGDVIFSHDGIYGASCAFLNGSPRNFHTKFAWGTGRRPTFRNFNFRPTKNLAGENPQNFEKKIFLPNGRQSKIHNFETARHIDKRIASLSSEINGLNDGTKFGGTPNQFWCNLGRITQIINFARKFSNFVH